jgi:hypothetical protein
MQPIPPPTHAAQTLLSLTTQRVFPWSVCKPHFAARKLAIAHGWSPQGGHDQGSKPQVCAIQPNGTRGVGASAYASMSRDPASWLARIPMAVGHCRNPWALFTLLPCPHAAGRQRSSAPTRRAGYWTAPLVAATHIGQKRQSSSPIAGISTHFLDCFLRNHHPIWGTTNRVQPSRLPRRIGDSYSSFSATPIWQNFRQSGTRPPAQVHARRALRSVCPNRPTNFTHADKA